MQIWSRPNPISDIGERSKAVYMVVIDLSQKALGRSAAIRQRRLAVLRLMLRGYSYSEAWDELSKKPWWRGWSAQAVASDMKILRKFIRDYGEVLPGYKEAVAWAISYYEDTIKEYDRLAREYEAMEKYELAARYRSMRDSLATKAFSALGVNALNLSVSPGAASGGSWEAVKVFFGIDIGEDTKGGSVAKSNSKSKGNKKRASNGTKGKKTKKGRSKGKNKG